MGIFMVYCFEINKLSMFHNLFWARSPERKKIEKRNVRLLAIGGIICFGGLITLFCMMAVSYFLR